MQNFRLKKSLQRSSSMHAVSKALLFCRKE